MTVDRNDITIIDNKECIKVILVHKYLNTPPDSTRRNLVKDNTINTVKYGYANYIELTTVFTLIKMQKEFWETHVEFQNACKEYSKSFLRQVSRIKIPYYAKTVNTSSEWACAISEINTLSTSIDKEFKLYMSRAKAREILCLSDINFTKTIIDCCIGVKKFNNNYYYLIKDIEFVKIQQQEIGIRYLPYKEVDKLYGTAIFTHITSYPLPYFAKRDDVFPPKSLNYYDKNEIEKYIADRDSRELFHSIADENLFKTFNTKLSISDNFRCLTELNYTYNKWLDYVSNYLKKINRNDRGKVKVVNSFVKITYALDIFLYENESKEIYTLTSANINLLLKTQRNQRNAMLLYGFVKLVAQDIQLKLKTVNGYNRGFNFTKINNPYKNKRNNDDEISNDVYEFKQYKELFAFLTNIEYHQQNIFNNTLTVKEKGVYLSNWLYLILHLNNAWRNGDILNFPILNLSDIENNFGIDSMNWFKSNTVTLDLARLVIAKVNRYEFTVNKTQVEGHFFCSDKLAPVFATVLIMLDMYIKYDYIGSKREYHTPVMNYYNKYNEPSYKGLKAFIRNAKIDNFEFLSKKMNKTILTYIYLLSDEKDSLLLSKHMRSHIKGDSTLHYLNINKKEIEFLTEQLFIRGEFGYIYDTLVNLIDNETKSLKSKTADIARIKNTFGDELKIEATLALLNYFSDERTEIMQLFINEGYENCVNTLNDIYMNKLPSRNENVQCLYSKNGCICHNIERCIDCKYSIPSIYALNTVCECLKEDFKRYNNTKNIPQKIKISAQLYRKKELLKEAIKRYGKEYIYSILEMESIEFLDTFSRIAKPDELTKMLREEN